MNKFLRIFSFVLLLSSCVSVKNYNADISGLHNVPELQSDVDLAYKKLQRLHPKLYQFISKEKLDYKFDSLKQSINAPMSSYDFYLQLAPVIASVRQGHLSLNSPRKKYTKKELKEINKKKFEFNGLAFESVADGFIIANNYGIDSTLIGSEVLMVEDDSIQKLVKQYKKLFSSDGYNTTFQDRIIAPRFQGYYSIGKDLMDSLTMTLKKQDSVFTRVFRRIPKDSLQKHRTKEDTSLLKEPVKLTKFQKKLEKKEAHQIRKKNKKYGLLEPSKKYTRNFDFIGKDSSVAYLKIRGFGNGPFKKFYKETFAKIDSAKTKTLILDLRDNPGGRLDEIAELYKYLVSEEHQFIDKLETKTRFPYLKSALSSDMPIFFKALNVIQAPISMTVDLFKGSKKDKVRYYSLASSRKNTKPKALNFKGKMYVLINGFSFSASSILSTNLHATKRATFVGEETGGHYNGTVAGVYKFLKLPNSKIKLNIGLLQLQAPLKTEINGYGIKPDVEIIPTIQDRLDGIDPELTWILKQLQ